jgi:hypothetical protein
MEFNPDAKFDFKILIGDEIPAYVTIEELQELLKEKAYQTEVDDFILSLKEEDYDIRTSTPKNFWLFPMWVSSHLLVQTCMQDPDAYDWAKITEMYNIGRIAEILYIWVHPYVWQPQTKRPINDSIILGKIATMQFDAGHAGFPAHQWLTKMIRERVLFFADHSPQAINDMELKEEGKVLKGMLLWNMIVTDARKYLSSYLNDDANIANIEYFNPQTFRENLQYIADQRNPQLAADTLRALRKDWKAILTWKCFNLDLLTPEQIEAFRACLFEGMDYYLEQWDLDKPQTSAKKTKQIDTFEPDYITFSKDRTSDYNIIALYQELLRLKWIEDGNPDNFTALFNGKISEETITWSGKVGKDNLYALFKMMVDHTFIRIPEGHSLQRIIETHFVNNQGKNIIGIDSAKPSKKALTVIDKLRQIVAARQTFDD